MLLKMNEFATENEWMNLSSSIPLMDQLCSSWNIYYQSTMGFQYCFSPKSPFFLPVALCVLPFKSSPVLSLSLSSLYLTAEWSDLLLLFLRKSSVLWFWRDYTVTHHTVDYFTKIFHQFSPALCSSISWWFSYALTQLHNLIRCAGSRKSLTCISNQ